MRNWERQSIEDLQSYEKKKQSISNITEQIEILNMQYTALRGQAFDSSPIQGGGSRMEDHLLDNIVKRERLQMNLSAVKRMVHLIERGLRSLDEKEREMLEVFFVNRPARHIDLLRDKYHVEQSEVYRMKDEALYKFTIGMYGMSDY